MSRDENGGRGNKVAMLEERSRNQGRTLSNLQKAVTGFGAAVVLAIFVALLTVALR